MPTTQRARDATVGYSCPKRTIRGPCVQANARPPTRQAISTIRQRKILGASPSDFSSWVSIHPHSVNSATHQLHTLSHQKGLFVYADIELGSFPILQPSSPLCPEFWCGAAASPRDTAKVGNDRRPGEELHSSSMVSYRAKGINKFTAVNLRLLYSNRLERIFLLAASFSAGSRAATAVAAQHPFRGDVSLSNPCRRHG